ncbi:DUF2752 domain-containing protein [Streptomyces sp. WMMC500]|uniref:DUF2752 domain-containing protein n=1 Tax=Streptomyces sp. WMMC500 TaxID=3015154 RepID=UPI00248AD412|nr:DUF2752 domain-containing protein [Streptomyces sp. WMMC500]WBB59963.1 DUF2752 domain-containing protein [Streptomyces sp. WMMC500]
MFARTAATVPLRRLAPPLAALACAAAGFAAVGALDPNEPGRYPRCPVPAYTGLACPGCGGLRAIHALAHGEVTAALGANALVVLGAAVLAVAVLRSLLAAFRPRPASAPGAQPRPAGAAARPARGPLPISAPSPGVVLFALVAAFTLVRNLSFGSVLGP